MNARRETGMVLVVSLMLLLMLTLLAIAAASQSSLQLRIASNSEQLNGAFQAAESGIQQWTSAYFAAAENTQFPDDWTATPLQTGSKERTSVTVVYSGPCPGSGVGRVSLNCFDLQSTGEVCDSSTCTATAIHRQGGQRRQLNQ